MELALDSGDVLFGSDCNEIYYLVGLSLFHKHLPHGAAVSLGLVPYKELAHIHEDYVFVKQLRHLACLRAGRVVWARKDVGWSLFAGGRGIIRVEGMHHVTVLDLRTGDSIRTLPCDMLNKSIQGDYLCGHYDCVHLDTGVCTPYPEGYSYIRAIGLIRHAHTKERALPTPPFLPYHSAGSKVDFPELHSYDSRYTIAPRVLHGAREALVCNILDSLGPQRRLRVNLGLLARGGRAGLPVVSPLASAGSASLPLRGRAGLPPELLTWMARLAGAPHFTPNGDA